MRPIYYFNRFHRQSKRSGFDNFKFGDFDPNGGTAGGQSGNLAGLVDSGDVVVCDVPVHFGIGRPHDLAELVGLADGHLVAGREVGYLGLKLFDGDRIGRRRDAAGIGCELDLAGVLTRDLYGPPGVGTVGRVGVYKSIVNALRAPVYLIIGSIGRSDLRAERYLFG